MSEAEADEMRGVAKGVLVLGAVFALALAQLPPPATARAAALPSDFNGDGYADLAIGAPCEDVGAIETAGAVNVLYGSRMGITAARDQYRTQDSPGLRGRSEGGDVFGRTLASGDFDRDGCADLAVGATADRTNSRGRGATRAPCGSPAHAPAATRSGSCPRSPRCVEVHIGRAGAGDEPDPCVGRAISRRRRSGEPDPCVRRAVVGRSDGPGGRVLS